MIKATINKETLRNKFAKVGAKKLGSGKCIAKPAIHNIVLNNYNAVASGYSDDKKINNDFSNVIQFRKERSVA